MSIRCLCNSIYVFLLLPNGLSSLKALSSVCVLFLVFFEVCEYFLFFLYLSTIVVGFLVGHFYFELIVFQLLLLSFDFYAKIKKLLLQSSLVLFEGVRTCSFLKVFFLSDTVFLVGKRGGKYFIDEFLTLFSQHL